MGFGTSILLSNTPNGTTWSVPSSGFANPSYLGGDINTAGLYQSDGFQIEQGTSLIVAFEGTYGAVTLFHEQTMDATGATGWFPVVGYALDNSSSGAGVSTSGEAYAFIAAGSRHRIRVTALASGTLVARAILTSDMTVAATASGGSTAGRGSPVSHTRPNDTTAYTAGDVIGQTDTSTAGAFAFPTIAGTAGGDVMITTASLEVDATSIPAGMTTFTLYLYSVTPPSAYVDNAAWDLAAGDRPSFLGSFSLGAPVDLGSTLYVVQTGVNLQVTAASGTLYGYLVTTGGFTPAAQTVFKVTLHTVAL